MHIFKCIKLLYKNIFNWKILLTYYVWMLFYYDISENFIEEISSKKHLKISRSNINIVHSFFITLRIVSLIFCSYCESFLEQNLNFCDIYLIFLKLISFKNKYKKIKFLDNYVRSRKNNGTFVLFASQLPWTFNFFLLLILLLLF